MSELNGANKTKRATLAPAKAAAVDPMSRVLATGPRIPVTVAIGAAIVLHVGAAAGATAVAMFDEIFSWQRGVREVVEHRLSQYELEVTKEEEKPPEPEPEPEKPPEPEPEPLQVPPPKDDTPPPPAPPAAAEAAKVLTTEPDSNAPVDLTDTFVSGTGSTFAGGVTAANGTSKTAVYNPAAVPTGVPGGTGTAPAPPPGPKVDRSRAAKLAGGSDWNCPFPAEADADQIDQAYVTIKVKLRLDGAPESVTVLQDPGHGFGREARKCAMGKRWDPPLDADGNPYAGSTNPIRVHFER